MSAPDKKLAELLSDESFVRWINGEGSEAENQRWELWSQKDPAHMDLRIKALELYQLPLALDEASDLDEQLDQLSRKIDQAEAETDESPSVIHRVPKNNKKKTGGYRLAVAAAIVLLLSIIGVITFNYRLSNTKTPEAPIFTTVEVGYGEKTLLKMSDGSQIRLNSKSSLRYSPEQMSSRRVEVWLEGEGYFEITHNPNGRNRPFIVHTPQGEVRVLGTRFNVKNRNKETSVVLEQGRVEVAMVDTLNNLTKSRIMEPGEMTILRSFSEDIVSQRIDVGIYTAWIDGRMKLSNTSLQQITESIEMTYGVILKAENNQILEQRLSGSIQNPDLQTFINGLEKILNLQIVQKDQNEFLITSQTL